MDVVYGTEWWYLASCVRASHFETLKKIRPDMLVTIEKEGRTKEVPIGELEDYAVWRYQNRLKRR